MKVTILGAGVVGITSAWYLAKAGHQVTVVDRQPGPALETSFANAGEVSFGYCSPWAAPGVPLKAAKWIFQKHAPLKIRPTMDMGTWSWMLQMLSNCTQARYAINKSRMVRISEHSRAALSALRDETGIQYDHRTRGTLEVFRTQKQLDGIGGDLKVLESYGVPYEVLDRKACTEAEPGLTPNAHKIAGGLRLPNDETGDCFIFTNELAKLCQARGVKFMFNTGIKDVRRQGNRVVAVETTAADIEADVFVAALGSYTPGFLRPLGINLPVYPVKGYSLTVPIVDESRAPVSTVMDENYKVAITRLGDRIRIGGTAEIAGFSKDLPQARQETLTLSVEELFGGAGDQSQAKFWSGLRPMTPDGTPVIGKTRLENLYLNTGHGTLGWTMACGSASILSDLVSGENPGIETDDLAIARYAA